MADICRIVRMAIKTRLADSTNGVNTKYAAIQSDYGTPDLEIDFGPDSSSFVWGEVPEDLIEESSRIRYPLLSITARVGQQDPASQRIRFHQYSGNVLGLIRVTLSWADESVTDFESWPDGVIAAMYDSLNDPNIPPSWGAGVTYNGDLNFSKAPVIMAGENWRRTINFPCTFKVIL